MSSAGWVSRDRPRRNAYDSKDQLGWARIGAPMDPYVPGRICDGRSVRALPLERGRPGVLDSSNLRQHVRPVGDRHGRGGFVVLPGSVAKLSGRRASSIHLDAAYVGGGGTSCVRGAYGGPGNQLAIEPAGMVGAVEIRVDCTDPAGGADRRRPDPVGPPGGGPAGGAAHPAEIWFRGPARRHRLG